MEKWKKFIRDAKKIAQTKGYLNKGDVEKLRQTYGRTRGILLNKLLDNKIPVEHKKHHILLDKLGIHKIENKTYDYDSFCTLPEWRNTLFKNSKIIIFYKCIKCDLESTSRLSYVLTRKYFIGQPICSRCILKTVANTQEWKSINSQAQLISQNKPEQLAKNRDAQIKRHKDPLMKIKHVKAAKEVWQRPEYREKMIKIAKAKWNDPIYAQKVIQNSCKAQKNGFYNGIFYNSSYELAFLLFEENKNGNINHIQRFNGYIPYKDAKGILRHYYPDFILNGKLIIEVKGYGPWIDFEKLKLKNLAAAEYCKNNNMAFRVVGRIDLGYSLIRKAIKLHETLKK